MIGILNYGVGNVQAFKRILDKNFLENKLISNKSDFSNVERIILPGVGHFDYAMKQLNKSGLRDRLDKEILLNHKKILGICVGLQMLGQESEEGNEKGLGYIKAITKKIDTNKISWKPKIPHMGWNNLTVNEINPLIESNSNKLFYYLHSYSFHPEDSNIVKGTSYYGEIINAYVQQKHIFGIQFHPEKSHLNGEKIIMNFSTFN